MSLSARLALLATWGLVGVLFITLLWRASQQSITHDEALSFLRYSSQGWGKCFGSYTANHHFLYTYLSKISIDVFGVSELGLRLPSLLGFLLYALALVRMTQRLCGPGWMQIGALGCLLGNPLLLDFFCLGRGYGLALGCLCMAWWRALEALEAGAALAPRQRVEIGLWLALSVGANLTFLIPTVALGCALLILETARFGALGRRLGSWFLALIPSLLLLMAIAAGPLRMASSGSFFFGSPSLRAMLRGLAEASVQHRVATLQSLLEPRGMVWFVADLLVPALLLFLIWRLTASWVGAKRRRGQLFVSALFICVLLSIVLHFTLGTPYPRERTGLYLIPLFGLALLEAVHGLRSGAAFGKARACLGLCFVFGLGIYALQFEVRYYRNWVYDAGLRSFVETMEDLQVPTGTKPLRVGVQHERNLPALQFYALQHGAKFMGAPTVLGAAGKTKFDYLILPIGSKDWGFGEGLVSVARHPLSGLMLVTGH